MIHEPRGAGSGQSTRLLSPSEKIAHGGNRTRGSLPLAPWPEERQPIATGSASLTGRLTQLHLGYHSGTVICVVRCHTQCPPLSFRRQTRNSVGTVLSLRGHGFHGLAGTNGQRQNCPCVTFFDWMTEQPGWNRRVMAAGISMDTTGLRSKGQKRQVLPLRELGFPPALHGQPTKQLPPCPFDP